MFPSNGQAPASGVSNGQAPASGVSNGQAPASGPFNGQAPASGPFNGQAPASGVSPRKRWFEDRRLAPIRLKPMAFNQPPVQLFRIVGGDILSGQDRSQALAPLLARQPPRWEFLTIRWSRQTVTVDSTIRAPIGQAGCVASVQMGSPPYRLEFKAWTVTIDSDETTSKDSSASKPAASRLAGRPHGQGSSSKQGSKKSSARSSGSEASSVGASVVGGNRAMPGILGVVFSSCFYAIAYFIPWAPMQRYFLGHPVSVAATVLFWFGIGVLLCKWLGVVHQSNRLSAIRDADLLPSGNESSPADRWLQENDAGHVARGWLADLAQLPSAVRSSHLVQRLEEVLNRQSQRGSTKHLADDLRELSGRDADTAHDSLGLIRIIVWAIPMLGFLGTVIGITQTLGGLDFTNGTAAVDNLKSGLYVAFDTTALGLVLSVVAIFLQFPVERGEQSLLASIDSRVGALVSAHLPSDETSDNQTVLIADLCRGVQAAVAESLDNQAKLWRDTIDEAQSRWQSVHDHNTNRLAEAFELTLVPALIQHAEALDDSSHAASDRLSSECEKWQATLDDAHQRLRNANESTAQTLADAFENTLKPALSDHAKSLNRSSQATAESLDHSARQAAERLEHQHGQWQQTIDAHVETLAAQQRTLSDAFENSLKPALHDHANTLETSAQTSAKQTEMQWQQWQQSMEFQADALETHQRTLVGQYEALTETHDRADAIVAIQQSLTHNLERLDQTNQAIDASIDAAAGEGMAEAMRILARAVDVLTAQLAETADRDDSETGKSRSRRAA